MTDADPPGGDQGWRPADPAGPAGFYPPGQGGYPGHSQYFPAAGGVGAGNPAAAQVCTWHPDRQTALRCTRCGRPACPECLTQASVGFQCRACVAEARGTRAQSAARTVSGSRWGQQPVVTVVLIAINVVFFLVTALQAHSASNLWASSLYRRGALIPAEVASGQYDRLVLSAFLHGSVLHIAMNMISLYLLGIVLERMIGRGRFLAVYLVSLLGSAVSVMLFSAPVSLTIGASGAIFGVFGALVAVFRRFRYDMRQLLVVLAINLFITFRVSGISWQGHLGGLIVGAIIGVAMVYPPRERRRVWQIGSVVVVVAILAGLLIYRDGQVGQWACQYSQAGMGCVPLG